MKPYGKFVIDIETGVSNSSELIQYVSSLQSKIPDIALYHGGIAKDKKPVVTVCRGIILGESKERVQTYLGNKNPFSAKISGIGFESLLEYDEVFLTVESPQLTNINAWIKRNCELNNPTKDRRPRIIIACVKPGIGKDLVQSLASEVEDIEFTVNSIRWENWNGKSLSIKLKPYVDFDHSLDIGQSLGVNFDDVDPVQFWKGINVELEHGNANPYTDVIPDINGQDDVTVAAKIALAHIYELPDYYDRLERMEGEHDS